MDQSLYFLVVATAAAGSAISAFFSWLTSRRTFYYQALADLRREYGSPEMMEAIRVLWNLRRKHADTEAMVDEYLEQMRSEEEQRMEVAKTLHYRRRLVSHFYRTLAALHQSNSLPTHVFFSLWSVKDLSIVPEILIPIDRALFEELFKEDSPSHRDNLLERFFEDAKRQEAWRNSLCLLEIDR